MTSYANTTISAAATDSKEITAAAAAVMTEQQQQQQLAIVNSSCSTMPSNQHEHSNRQLHHHADFNDRHHHYQQQLQQQQQYNHVDVAAQQVAKQHQQQQQKTNNSSVYKNYDCDDSLSDEREKGDSTPENLKKIDNIIEQQEQQHQFDAATSATAAATTMHSKLPAALPNLLASNELMTTEMDFSNGSQIITSLTSAATASNHDDDSITPASDSCPKTTPTSSNIALTPNKQSFAFTIDNFNDKDCNPAAKAAKYKNMMERFQNRHRRGASLSKIENVDAAVAKDATTTATTVRPASASASASSPVPTARSTARMHANQTDAEKMSISRTDTVDSNAKVKLRARNRSTSRVRDASKRHSWSPRSSTQEQPTAKTANPKQTTPAASSQATGTATRFMPRSQAMQMAMQNVDFLCAQPPLADLKHLQLGSDIASETGTYTLDGDLYTEEQKNHMNIESKLAATAAALQQRPKNLNLKTATVDTKIPVHISSGKINNVLEVNYYHDDILEQQQQLMPPISPRLKQQNISNFSNASDQQKDLQQQQRPTARLKPIVNAAQNTRRKPASAQPPYSNDLPKDARANVARIKSANATLNNNNSNDMILDQSALAFFEAIRTRLLGGDVMERSSPAVITSTPEQERDAGCFTSVTTSGVLAKQRTLAACPLRNRRSSLSTSQIDSSDYTSSETILKNSIASETQSIPAAAHVHGLDSPPDTPTTPITELSDTAILKTAKTKKDWIQEWARNARARSLACEEKKTRQASKLQQEGLMTRSYTCASSDGMNELPTDCQPLTVNCCTCDSHDDLLCKPPKSPSKIPSPLHSMGRARSASRMRQLLPQYEEDIYLQNTAAVLQSLQESLTRMNALKSPTHSAASPRASSAHVHATIYSPDGRSPQHSLDSPTHQHTAPIGGTYQHYAAQYHQRNSPLHRRNVAATASPYQLMTSSINEQQLQLLTSGEYLARQMRRRKNSFDGNVENFSPRRQAVAPPTTLTSYDEAQQPTGDLASPLRRSSSFSAKLQAQQKTRAARPQFQNIYTPPAARHNNALTVPNAAANSIIKKSASSNNFAQAYSDYDDDLEYYINDEDDLADESYSSDCEGKVTGDDDDDEQQSGVNVNPAVPLSNTRYNKALLIRIERSKQKIAGKVSSAPVAAKTNTAFAGLAACPNTPELPRRAVKSATRAGMPRQSVPRDTSLSRLAKQVPNSLASAKKQLLQTAAAAANNRNQRVQSKYLDFSKNAKNTTSSSNSNTNANNFLRRSDLKSNSGALKTNADAMKRSPSSSSMGVTRADPMRASNRSNKSIASTLGINGSGLTGNSSRASSAARRDASVSKQKEVEMAMWKRRSKYDPMKAAAEDRRKKEEAKRLTLNKNEDQETPCERPSRSTYRRGYYQ